MTLRYQAGFGNTFSTEAEPGALPVGQNSPQQAPRGLIAEVFSGSAFTAPRHENLSSWLYRLRPSAMHGPFRRMAQGLLRSGPFDEVEASPNRLRWNPWPIPSEPMDFLDGLVTIAGSGDAATQHGLAVHVYRANRPMENRYFYDADGELMLVPQEGAIALATELGRLEARPGEIAVIPRGTKFQVLPDGPSRGYVCENYGPPFRLPELGPIGSQGTRPEARLPGAGGGLRGQRPAPARWWQSSWARYGWRNAATPRSTWWPGTATTRRTPTTWDGS